MKCGAAESGRILSPSLTCLVLTNACLEPPLPRAGHLGPTAFCTGRVWHSLSAWLQGPELGWGLCVRSSVLCWADCVC